MKRAAYDHVRSLNILNSSRRLYNGPISIPDLGEEHNRITVTPHALDKVGEVLKINDRFAAELLIIDSLRRSRFIGYIANLRTKPDGTEFAKIDRLFSCDGLQLVLDRTDNVVITIYKRKDIAAEVQQLVDSRGDSVGVLNSMLGLLASEEYELIEAVQVAEMAAEIGKALENVGVGSVTHRRKLQEDLEAASRELLAFLIEKKSRYLKGIAFFV